MPVARTSSHSQATASSRRRSVNSSSSQLKFRPPGSNESHHGRGTRPLPEPMAVGDFIQMIVIHGCKKVLLFNQVYKCAGYLAITFVLSILADFVHFPRSYFSNPKNTLNALFVAFGWGWTLLAVTAFVTLTGLVHQCGNRRKLAVYHLFRIVVGTMMWWLWTTGFASIELTTGTCSLPGQIGKRACREAGGKWRAFDISGHTFLLVYCNLILMEEAKAILGWDGIKDTIRREEYNRNGSSANAHAGNKLDAPASAFGDDETYLKDLSDAQFAELKFYYPRVAFWARVAFVAMTFLSLIYDVLLLATLAYFHVMVEKLVATAAAIGVWLLTYRFWFVRAPFPVCPGVGYAFKCEPAKNRGLSPAQKGPKRKNTLTGGISAPSNSFGEGS